MLIYCFSFDNIRSNSIVSMIDAVISLNVPHETIMERMAQRWIHAPSGRTYSYDYNPPKEKGTRYYNFLEP